MKTWIWILIVIGVLLVVSAKIYPIFESSNKEVSEEPICNFTNTKGCKLECNSDSDCIIAGSTCSCINKSIDFHSSCLEFGPNGRGCSSGVACLSIGECKCVNGQCKDVIGGVS
jgi:hypothetical protein